MMSQKKITFKYFCTFFTNECLRPISWKCLLAGNQEVDKTLKVSRFLVQKFPVFKTIFTVHVKINRILKHLLGQNETNILIEAILSWMLRNIRSKYWHPSIYQQRSKLTIWKYVSMSPYNPLNQIPGPHLHFCGRIRWHMSANLHKAALKLLDGPFFLSSL